MKFFLIVLLVAVCVLEIGAKPMDVSSEEEMDNPQNADSTLDEKRISKKSLKMDDLTGRSDAEEDDDEDGDMMPSGQGGAPDSAPVYYEVKKTMEQLQDPKLGMNATQPTAGNWTNPAGNPVSSNSTPSQAKQATNGTVPAVADGASQKPTNQTAVKSQPQMMAQTPQNATQTTAPSATQPPTTPAPVIVAKSNTTANATTA